MIMMSMILIENIQQHLHKSGAPSPPPPPDLDVTPWRIELLTQ